MKVLIHLGIYFTVMEIVILGMHRSGTSMLTRLVNMMGVHFGDEEDGIGSNEENPRGFWERKDVRIANDAVLHSLGCDWDRLTDFSIENLSNDVVEEFCIAAGKIIESLSGSVPFLLKEPRICVLLPLWLKVLKDPVFIYIHRNPLEVAQSLKVRNSIPVMSGIALWEYYNRAAVEGVNGQRIIYASHKALLKDPYTEVQRIFQQIDEIETANISCPSREEVEAFIDTSLYRQRSSAVLEGILNSSQIRLTKGIEENGVYDFSFANRVSEGALLALKSHEETCVLKDRLKLLKRDIDVFNESSKALQRDNDVLNKRSKVLQRYNHVLKKELDVLNNAIKEGCRDLEESKNRISVIDDELDWVNTQVNMLIECIDEVFLSARWRIGSALVSLKNLFLFRPYSQASAQKAIISLKLELEKRK